MWTMMRTMMSIDMTQPMMMASMMTIGNVNDDGS